MKRMILIVDDEERIRFVLRKALKKLDDTKVEVETAGTAADGLRKAESCVFDLIISDLIMPDMDGIEFTEKIRDIQRETPVVWMTAYGCRSFATEAERLNVFRCVEKPLEIQHFRDLAQAAMAGDEQGGDGLGSEA